MGSVEPSTTSVTFGETLTYTVRKSARFIGFVVTSTPPKSAATCSWITTPM